MATYITLLKYTEQGLKTIKESPSRLERAKQLLKSLGGELKSFHLVQGRYDAGGPSSPESPGNRRRAAGRPGYFLEPRRSCSRGLSS